MPKVLSLLSTLATDYKNYSPVILAVISGVGSIAAKNYSGGLEQILQALTVLFSGATAVAVHQAASK